MATKHIKHKKPTIGFVGNGFVGKNIADDFERRGYKVERFALEAPYNTNMAAVNACDIVFVAVPTPTNPDGFDISIVEDALKSVTPAKNKIVVVKSTILPGTTVKLQKKFKKLTLLFCPEFLGESTAAYDAQNPIMDIVGMPIDNPVYRKAAKKVMSVLPEAPFKLICSSTEAEIKKYAHNISGYVQIVVFNMFYDITKKLNADWAPIQQALVANPFIASRYSVPVHKGGRGAGGNCFIKDFAALRGFVETALPKDPYIADMLKGIEKKNLHLLSSTKKDQHLVKRVYGDKKAKQK